MLSPLAVLPFANDATPVAVRFAPTRLSLRPDSAPDAYVDLPYRMVFAVATQNAVSIHDTQQRTPIAHVRGIHYLMLTDLAWSADARRLAVASRDGYITVITFDEGELGVPLADAPAIEQAAVYNAQVTRGAAKKGVKRVGEADGGEAPAVATQEETVEAPAVATQEETVEAVKTDDEKVANEKAANEETIEKVTNEKEVNDKEANETANVKKADETVANGNAANETNADGKQVEGTPQTAEAGEAGRRAAEDAQPQGQPPAQRRRVAPTLISS